MPDYNDLNEKIKNIVKFLEQIPNLNTENDFSEFFQKYLEKFARRTIEEKEENLLALFSQDMDSLSSRLILIYFIHMSRSNENVRSDIKLWVLDSLEKALHGEEFEQAFSIKEKKRPKADLGMHLKIRADFEILRRKGIGFQEAQEICAEKWSVSETTVATIHRGVQIPDTSDSVLRMIALNDFVNMIGST